MPRPYPPFPWQEITCTKNKNNGYRQKKVAIFCGIMSGPVTRVKTVYDIEKEKKQEEGNR